MGCDAGTITGGADATAPGDGVVTSSAVGSSKFVMIGVEGNATRAGGALATACEGGGRLGVPTESTGWLEIFGVASSRPLELGGASGKTSGGFFSLMRA